MRLENKKFAIIIAAAASIVYAACSMFVYLFPKFSMTLMSSLTHLDSSLNSRIATLDGFIVGLAQVFLYSCILGFIFAWVFNKSLKNN